MIDREGKQSEWTKATHSPGPRPTESVRQQVTRGHNIISDLWAGASDRSGGLAEPNPPPTPPHIQTYTKVTKFLVFPGRL